MSEYGISDKSLRTYWLMKKYAVIIPAAINAKISPYKASPHAHQLKNFHYPQVTKNVILSKKLARKGDIFYESFDSR